MRLIAMLLLCAALPVTALVAADIYVDAGAAGNDANPGTIGSPKKTIAGAHTAANNGDTIILRAGTYAGDITISKNNITLRSHTGEWAIVSTGNGTSDPSECIWITGSACTLSRLEVVGGSYYCIKFEGTDGHIVEDCKVHDSGRDCFKITPQSDNITIRRCEIYNSGIRDSSNAEGIDNVNGDNMHVHDCYIHNIATNGVYPKGGARNAIIERNLIVGCGTGGVYLGFSTDSVWMNQAGDNNPSYYENIDGTVRNNIIMNTTYAGIGFCSALNAKVYNNTLINVAQTGQSALHFHPRDGDNGQNPPCTGLDVRNNIVYVSSSRPFMTVRTGTGGYNTLASGGLTMNYNRYHRASGSVTFNNDQTGQSGITLTNWRTLMGTDANSTEGATGLNLTTGHLNAGSACIGQAVTIAGFTDDFDGNTRSGAWDIGADQTGGTELATPPAAGTIGTGGGTTPPSPTVPAAASALNASATAGLNASLTWTDNSTNETGFRIERREGAGSYAQVGSVAANTTSFNDSGLVEGLSYTYRVIAYNGVGDATPSNEDTITAASTPTGGGTVGTGEGGSSGGGGCAATGDGMMPILLPILLAMLAYRRRRRCA